MDNFIVAEAPVIRSFTRNGKRILTLTVGRPDNESVPKDPIAYDRETHVMSRGEKKVLIAGELEYFICESLFSKSLGTRVTWDEILDPSNKHHWSKAQIEKNKRRVRDAKNRLNERIEREFGVIEFVNCINGEYCRK